MLLIGNGNNKTESKMENKTNIRIISASVTSRNGSILTLQQKDGTELTGFLPKKLHGINMPEAPEFIEFKGETKEFTSGIHAGKTLFSIYKVNGQSWAKSEGGKGVNSAPKAPKAPKVPKEPQEPEVPKCVIRMREWVEKIYNQTFKEFSGLMKNQPYAEMILLKNGTSEKVEAEFKKMEISNARPWLTSQNDLQIKDVIAMLAIVNYGIQKGWDHAEIRKSALRKKTNLEWAKWIGDTRDLLIKVLNYQFPETEEAKEPEAPKPAKPAKAPKAPKEAKPKTRKSTIDKIEEFIKPKDNGNTEVEVRIHSTGEVLELQTDLENRDLISKIGAYTTADHVLKRISHQIAADIRGGKKYWAVATIQEVQYMNKAWDIAEFLTIFRVYKNENFAEARARDFISRTAAKDGRKFEFMPPVTNKYPMLDVRVRKVRIDVVEKQSGYCEPILELAQVVDRVADEIIARMKTVKQNLPSLWSEVSEWEKAKKAPAPEVAEEAKEPEAPEQAQEAPKPVETATEVAEEPETAEEPKEPEAPAPEIAPAPAIELETEETDPIGAMLAMAAAEPEEDPQDPQEPEEAPAPEIKPEMTDLAEINREIRELRKEEERIKRRHEAIKRRIRELVLKEREIQEAQRRKAVEEATKALEAAKKKAEEARKAAEEARKATEEARKIEEAAERAAKEAEAREEEARRKLAALNKKPEPNEDPQDPEDEAPEGDNGPDQAPESNGGIAMAPEEDLRTVNFLDRTQGFDREAFRALERAAARGSLRITIREAYAKEMEFRKTLTPGQIEMRKENNKPRRPKGLCRELTPEEYGKPKAPKAKPNKPEPTNDGNEGNQGQNTGGAGNPGSAEGGSHALEGAKAADIAPKVPEVAKEAQEAPKTPEEAQEPQTPEEPKEDLRALKCVTQSKNFDKKVGAAMWKAKKWIRVNMNEIYIKEMEFRASCGLSQEEQERLKSIKLPRKPKGLVRQMTPEEYGESELAKKIRKWNAEDKKALRESRAKTFAKLAGRIVKDKPTNDGNEGNQGQNTGGAGNPGSAEVGSHALEGAKAADIAPKVPEAPKTAKETKKKAQEKPKAAKKKDQGPATKKFEALDFWISADDLPGVAEEYYKNSEADYLMELWQEGAQQEFSRLWNIANNEFVGESTRIKLIGEWMKNQNPRNIMNSITGAWIQEISRYNDGRLSERAWRQVMAIINQMLELATNEADKKRWIKFIEKQGIKL